MRSGFVGLIGRPNVGKSTLLNNIIGTKIAITSNVPGTTRNAIQGIYTDSNCQMVLIDTPGIHKPHHKLGRMLNKQAYVTTDDVDVILFLVDITEEIGKGDKYIIDILKKSDKPVILVINKIDRLPKDIILTKINEYKDLLDFDEIVPVSAMKGDNVDRLIDVLKNYLTDNIKYFDDDMITNVSNQFIIGEMVREKILELTNEEVPHSVSTSVERMTEEDGIIHIMCDIIVDRDSLKKIIIGKGGSMVKEIGQKARADIEKLLGKKVYLELYVKTVPKWREKDKFLNDTIFKDFDF